MTTIISFVSEEQRSFEELSFTPLDSLVLSVVSYFNFEEYDQGDFGDSAKVNLHDILALSDRSRVCARSWLADSSGRDEFWASLMASRRYRAVTLGFYVNEISTTIEKQFSAVSFFLPHAGIYLAFRGTDGSFAGWKEDFNMSFKQVIPSQVSAARYLSGVASATTESLILGGHSKGGNLAEYAALVADDDTYNRIIGIYNHDGPAFLESPSPRFGTEPYMEKLHKTVPESSAFGMILEQRDSYRVVRSNARFVFQHEPFTWYTEGDDFLYQDELNKTASFFDSSVDKWLRSHSSEERKRLIDTVYELFASTKADNWSDFHNELLRNARHIISEGGKLDPETRRFILNTITALAVTVKDEALKKVRPDSRKRMNGKELEAPSQE